MTATTINHLLQHNGYLGGTILVQLHDFSTHNISSSAEENI